MFRNLKITCSLKEVRDCISGRLKKKFDIDADADQIILTSGANQAFMNAILALFDEGDEVLLPTPFYFNHDMALKMCGVKPVYLEWNSLEINRELIEKNITEKTKAIVIVNPSNPLGTSYDLKDINCIKEIALEHDLYIISDETYMEIIFEDKKHISPAMDKRVEDRTILISSFSKSLAVPGFRIGFMKIPRELVSQIMKVQDTIAICAPHLSQLAVLHLMPKIDTFLETHLFELQRRRDIIEEFLNDNDIQWIKPHGGLFCMININNENSLEFCLELVRKTGVILIPGSSFGNSTQSWVRLSFGSTPRAILTNGLDRIKSFLGA